MSLGLHTIKLWKIPPSSHVKAMTNVLLRIRTFESPAAFSSMVKRKLLLRSLIGRLVKPAVLECAFDPYEDMSRTDEGDQNRRELIFCLKKIRSELQLSAQPQTLPDAVRVKENLFMFSAGRNSTTAGSNALVLPDGKSALTPS